MKKFLSAFALIMVLALSLTCFIACSPETPEQPSGDDANKVTVCWYQGSKLLKEEKIEKGSKVTSWTPMPLRARTSPAGTPRLH